jgi:hypothetical protein
VRGVDERRVFRGGRVDVGSGRLGSFEAESDGDDLDAVGMELVAQ